MLLFCQLLFTMFVGFAFSSSRLVTQCEEKKHFFLSAAFMGMVFCE